MISIFPEAESIDCPAGGYLIQSGLDINNNDTLDEIEVQTTEYVCHGIDADYDKQIIIPFIGVNTPRTSSVTGIISTERELKGFNINNYPGADSIVFGGFPETMDSQVECIVELYDKTNNKPIDNSKLISNATTLVWQTTTVNFINELPTETIDLGIYIKSRKEGTVVYMFEPTLIRYRY